MKILQLIPNLSSGGAERFVVDLSNELAKEHEVHLVTLYDPCEKDLFRKDISSSIKPYGLAKHVGFDVQVFFRLRGIIRQIKPDVIHCHLRSFNYLMPVIFFKKKIPVVHTVHSDAFAECSNLWIRKFRNYFFKKKNVIPVTISEESNRSFKEAYRDVKATLIPNGRCLPVKTDSFEEVKCKIENYKRDRNTKIFVHIGRLSKEKNQIMLVKAFQRLTNQDKANTALLIIGRGRDDKESTQIYQELNEAQKKSENIVLLGERLNATDYLYLADYFCLASLYEGMPMTLIESLAMNTIPVCTAVGGMTEMVSELDRDLLAEEVTVEAYYQALKRAYVLSDEQRKVLEDKAVNLFKEKYSIEQCAGKYARLYLKLILNN